MQYIIFLLEKQQFGLNLTVVERVLNMVEITPLPNAPSYLRGAIDFHGEAIPVIHLRRIMGLPDKDIALSDHLLLCRFNNHLLALWVDQVTRIANHTAKQCIENQMGSKMQGVEQIIEEQDQLIFIIDIHQLLPFDTKLAAISKL